MIERLLILKSKKFNSAKDLQDALEKDNRLKHEVEVLTKHFLGRSVSGCGNCFFDAYMELINIKKMEKKKFRVKAGTVLYDPVSKKFDKILTAANCTDELALYHLKHNKDCKKYFSILPDDVDEMVENFEWKEPKAPKVPKAPKTKKEVIFGEKELADIESVKTEFTSGKTKKEIIEVLKAKGYSGEIIGKILSSAKA